MLGAKFMGLFALVHAVGLLTASFFVLVVARKTDSQGLKTFGTVIAVLLWISAALVFSAGVYKMNKDGVFCGRRGMMMHKMMPGQMEGGPMMHNQTMRTR